MSIEVVCGTNWGDEGKGRMVDYLAQDADLVIRYQGGNNAGHTVVNEFGTFKLHLIPSGIFNPGVMNVLGPGMVIDLAALCDETAGLEEAGIDTSGIRLSERATISFPFHSAEDSWEEERLGETAYGSTKRGIAPVYGDRFLKKGIQVGELLYPERLKERLRALVEWKNLIARGVYGKEGICYDEVLDWTLTHGERVKRWICDTTSLLHEAARGDKNILFEAQLGALRDVYFGIYPFTTSSCALAAFAPIGGGLFGTNPSRVIGVMKAFSTCVGAGPFVTEVEGEVAENLRETAHEYGASTGRPRRIGHFDGLASRYGATVQNVTEIALTKLDCLSGIAPLLICTHYEFEGRRIDNFPLNAVLENARPVYIEMESWEGDLTGCRHFDELPAAAQTYVRKIEEVVGRRVRFVSVGPERDCLIDRGA